MSDQPLSVPVDAGLTGLGMLARVAAGVGLCASTIALVMMPAVGLSVSRAPLAFVWLLLCLVRGVLHLRVADHALRRSPQLLAAARVYLIAGLGHTAFGLVLVVSSGLAEELLLFLASGLCLGAGWPAALYLLTHRRAVAEGLEAAETFDASLTPPDLGASAVAVLLMAFSAMTMALPLLGAVALFKEGNPAPVPTILLLLCCAAFIIRGGHAFRLGLRVSTGALPARALRTHLGRYHQLAIASAVLLIIGLLSTPPVRMALGSAPLPSFVTLAALIVATLVWPQTLRAYLAQTAAEEAISEPLETPPPATDRGVTTLGAFLLLLAPLDISRALSELGTLSLPGLDVLLSMTDPASTFWSSLVGLGKGVATALLGVSLALLGARLAWVRGLVFAFAGLSGVELLLGLIEAASLPDLPVTGVFVAGAGTVLHVATIALIARPAMRRHEVAHP